ncbi:MAG TPA: regulatory protein RecX [Dehalococcoidia bacterium]|nr:regulatory protein RecX [Dehalococcoidia bacterium]
MPRVTEIHRKGRNVEVSFDDETSLRCDRAFQLAQTFAVDQDIDALILDRVRDQAALHYAEAASLRWLKARPRSRAEIGRRLRARGISQPIVDTTLDALEKHGHLNDRAYAAAFTDDRVRRQSRSASLIQNELEAQGIDAAVAAEATSEIDDDGGALALAMKRARRHRGDWPTFQRRVGAALTRRGYSYDIAKKAIRTAWETRPDFESTDRDESASNPR